MGQQTEGVAVARLTEKVVRIVKADAAKRIVYGEVYAPNVMDSQGEFMFAEDIEQMAHEFMRLKLDESIDTNHDRVANGCYPVESFIAREGDPDYTPGAWVLGVKCTDDMWEKVEKGEINAYSFDAMVQPLECEVEVETYRDHFGQTEKSEDHAHLYFLHVSEAGKVLKGWTDAGPDGHTHGIGGGSKTLPGGADLHTHRFFL